MSKRIFDVVGALILLLVFLIPMIIIAICIKASSPRKSILFCQERVGLNGQAIIVCKFRTFKENESQCSLKTLVRNKYDVRITLFGKYLRSSHLDELPQIWSVLIGDMSLVGPRPTTRSIAIEVADEVPDYVLRHRVRPGLTGPAQVHGGKMMIDEINCWARLDIEYATSPWILQRDLKILFQTIGVVLRCRGT